MPQVAVYNLNRDKVGSVDLDPEIFGVEVREHLYYEVVRMQLANRRAGTAATKGRADVAYSTAKLYKQKGTGRARKGSRKSPTLRGGGTIHGPQPRSYTYRVPRSMRRAAIRSALSGRVAEQRLVVIDDFALPGIKTRALEKILGRFQLDNGLLVDVQDNGALRLSARNLTKFKFLAPEGLNVYDVLRFDNLVMSRAAVDLVQGALKR